MPRAASVSTSAKSAAVTTKSTSAATKCTRRVKPFCRSILKSSPNPSVPKMKTKIIAQVSNAAKYGWSRLPRPSHVRKSVTATTLYWIR